MTTSSCESMTYRDTANLVRRFFIFAVVAFWLGGFTFTRPLC